MEKVSKEMAILDIEKWLEFKRVKESTRENYKTTIEELANAVSDGVLYLDDEHNLVQNLIFPIQNEITTDKLVFRPRLKIGEIQKSIQGLKSDDAQGMVLGIVSTLTGKAKGIIKDLDVEDYGICQNIALFFIPK